MKKNTTSLFIFLLLKIVIFGQEKSYEFSGKVVDANTNKPISDVIVLLNNNQVGYTNKEGKFKCSFLAKEKDSINFYHTFYDYKTVSLSDLTTGIVKLKEKTIELDEVVIGGIGKNTDELRREFYKDIRKKFKKGIRETPYWSSVNFKQITSINDTLPAYLEVDGDILMYGSNYTSVWDSPILIPKKSRRTVENFMTYDGKFFNDKNKDTVHHHYAITYLCYDVLIDYHFFERTHPLLTKGLNYYDFTIENTIEIDDKEHYVIGFSSKKEKTKIIGRKFYNIQGQLIIDKEKSTLRKVTAFYRNQATTSIFTVDYQEIEELLYPKTISYNLSFTTNKNKIIRKGQFNFSQINTEELEKPRNIVTGNRFLFTNSKIYNDFDSDYWKNKPLFTESLGYEINEIFDGKSSENLFIEGANQKISTISKYSEEENKILKLKKEHH